MRRKGSSSRKSSQAGPGIVRAWFDTVINPLLSCLEREQYLLANKNWTWRFRPASLETIRQVRTYVDPEARANLEQFEELHPGIKRERDAHDKLVLALVQNCQHLHKVLVTSADLQDLFLHATSEDSLRNIGLNLRDLFGSYPEPEYRDLLAEYIVNNAGELPSYYSIAPLWNQHRSKFLSILDRPTVRDLWAATIQTGKALMRETDRLSRLLKEIRLRLSLEHDVPYVTRG
jgi:hypothetical protein